jgi:hypothetical protein
LQQLLPQLKGTQLFQNISPSRSHWLSAGAGIGGLSYTMLITGSYVGIELSITRASKEENKSFFNTLFSHKEQIESIFGGSLIWEELPNNKMSRIKTVIENINLFNEKDWQKMNAFFIENLPLFIKAFEPNINQIKK